MSFFTELKQRNVFKVAIAYTVVGWLLIQVAEVVAPQMNLPEWTPRMITFVVMLGFPVSLVMAWALELTPEGVKKAEGKNLPVYVIAAALLALSIFWFLGKKESAPAPETAVVAPTVTTVEPTGIVGMPSVAVLPFVNMSADAENEYFSDGMTEELLNLLVQIEGLRVPSRTSSFAFKGQNTDIREIATQLEVNHILEGSVRKSGNQIRITAQLIDVSTDSHIWSNTYDRQLEDVFAIQDEIANEIVNALHFTLQQPRSTSKPTDNMAAYNLYLQGRHHFQQRGMELIAAEEYLRQAVELDPNFAEAWAVLSLVHVMKPNYIDTPLSEAEPASLDAARKAEALNPKLAEPQMARANLFGKHSNLVDQITLMEEATRKQPHNALARTWLGIALLEGGYLKESRRQLERAMRDDPLSGLTADWLSRVVYFVGESDTAKELAHRAIEFGRWPAFLPLAHIYLDQGEFEATRTLLNVVPFEPFRSAFGPVIDAREDPAMKSEAHRVLETIRAQGNDPAKFISTMVYLYLGDADKLLSMMPEAIPSDATIYTGLWAPVSRVVRQHPDMHPFARNHGLIALWQARGWPDLCRPLGEINFECD